MIGSILESLHVWLEGVELLPNPTDEEREKARKVLKAAGLSLDQVERGGVIYALRKAIKIVELIGKGSGTSGKEETIQ